MKKIAIFILTIFFVLAALDGVLKTPWVKQKALDYLSESLEGTGWNIAVGTVESAFPNISVKDVKIETDTFALYFGSVQAKLSLLRVLKNEVFLSEVKADLVSWEIKEIPSEELKAKKTGSSFTLNIHDFTFSNAELLPGLLANLEGKFVLKNRRKTGLKIRTLGKIHPISQNPLLSKTWDFSIDGEQNASESFLLQKIHLTSDDIAIQGTTNFKPEGPFEKGSFQVQSNTMTLQDPISFHFRLLAQVDLERRLDGIFTTVSWRLPYLEIYETSFFDTYGHIEALYSNGSFTGNLSGFTHFLGVNWEGKSPFSWESQTRLSFSEIQIESPILKSTGNLKLEPDKNVSGTFEFTTEQLNALIAPFYGKASGKISILNPTQIQLDCNLSNFYYESAFAEAVSIHSDLTLPIHDLSGTILCDVKNGKWKDLTLDSAALETTKGNENWSYELNVAGTLKHPFDADLSGNWNYVPQNLKIDLEEASGSFFNHPFSLAAPSRFLWTPDILQLKNFSLQLSDATIDLFVDRKQQDVHTKLAIHKLPLDVLSINPLDIDLTGTFDMDLEIQETKDKMKGNFQANINDMQMHLLGQKDPVLADGTFSGNFAKDNLTLIGSLKVQESSLFQLNLKLPVHLEVWPPAADLIHNKTANGQFYLKGRIEEFLDFANLGTHRIEGDCLCDLTLSNTLENPALLGKCTLSDGYYQNYYTGTELKEIHADFTAVGKELQLTSLTAQDSQNKGSFTGTGSIKLLPKENFPYKFDLTLNRFNIATLDLVTSEASGDLEITGDLKEGFARGKLEILESDVNIPSRIPRSLPELQVVYKNAEKPPVLSELPPGSSYPLYLNLNIDAPDGIFISGRGLDSEWKGNFLVQGTQTDIATQGKIELIKGKFVFSGREFKLNEGSLTFSGEKNEMPFLNLGATIEIKDISITAHLTGPLNNPQVILSSSPPLPMGTIMAYLLFGQDLTEINSFQALQLANSIANLAGESPGILEQTRKSIGVDRIEIITVPSASAEGGETIAIQVGKYVTEGVLVSFSQGAEEDSSNISIEVEAQGGLSFLLESDQSQEQGKFTIRWSHTY